MLNKIITALLVSLIIIMVVSTTVSLSIRSMEREINLMVKDLQSTLYKIQDLKGTWNIYSSPKSLERMIRLYLPNMHIIPLNTNVSSIPLKEGVKAKQ